MRIIRDTQFYDLSEFAQMLGVSLVTVRRIVKEHNLKTETFMRKKHLTEQQIVKYLESLK